MMPETIRFFTGEHEFLSNFAECPNGILYEGITYPTTEHAYQAAKTLSVVDRLHIAALPSPGLSKREGRKLDLREDWETQKIGVMLECLRIKFSDPDMMERLRSTGDQTLIEGNHWGDSFWGMIKDETGAWVGENHLGDLLMHIRGNVGSV